MNKRTSKRQALSTVRQKGNSPHFIPLTQADLDRGLSEEQLARLSEALNVKLLFKELYRLGLQHDAEQNRPGADEAA